MGIILFLILYELRLSG